MLMPRKVAHRKHHRGRTRGMTKGGSSLHFGEFGIQALEPGWLTARQIEAAEPATPLLKDADPELEKLLDEEETIARQTRTGHETPHFRGDD